MAIDPVDTGGAGEGERCVFCDIVNDREFAVVVARGGHDMIIEPLNPVVPGHVLVIPHKHVTDATDDPAVTARTFQSAAWFTKNRGPKHFNLITSVGMLATQSVPHLHIHIIPRSQDDGLMLPWGDNSSQSREYRDNAYEFYNGTGQHD